MINAVFTFLGAGMVLGLSAGLSPGPLLALVISHTLRHGIREGAKVALAPLLTDLPIILVSLLVLKQFSNAQTVLGVVSIIGGMFVTYLAYESFRANPIGSPIEETIPQSLTKGAMVNLLNPHPYLFWLTVGAPMMIKAWAQSGAATAGFLIAFYMCLVGSKLFVALVTGRSRQRIQGKIYLYIMRCLGALLLIFAFLLFKDGVGLLGLIG